MICTFFPSPALVPEIVSKTACMLIEQIVVGVSNKCHYNRTACNAFEFGFRIVSRLSLTRAYV